MEEGTREMGTDAVGASDEKRERELERGEASVDAKDENRGKLLIRASVRGEIDVVRSHRRRR
jgi:hypothetical protein